MVRMTRTVMIVCMIILEITNISRQSTKLIGLSIVEGITEQKE